MCMLSINFCFFLKKAFGPYLIPTETETSDNDVGYCKSSWKIKLVFFHVIILL